MAGKIEQAELPLTESVAQTDQALAALNNVVERGEVASGPPEAWIATKFTEVLDVQGGTQPPKAEFIFEPAQDYIRLLQIRDFGKKPIPNFVPVTTKLKTCEKTDVLIGRYGASLGRICTGMEGAYNVALAKVLTFGDIEGRYLKHFLNSENFQMPLRLLSRSAQNGFNKNDLATFDFPLPPLAEQTVIAQTLDTLLAQVDNIKTRLDAIPKILKTFRQSVLAAAVSGKLTEEWRGENSDSLLTGNQYKDLLCELNSGRSESEKKRIIKAKSADWFYDRSETIPEGWIQSNLIEITKLITCGVAKKPDYTEEGVPFLSAQNSKPFSPNLNKIKYIKEDDFNTFTVGGKPEKNDVLYSRVGANFGEACVIPWDFDFAIYVSLTLIKPVHEILNSQYLTQFLNSIDGVLQSRGGILGSGIQNLNVESVRKYRIPLPSIQEQIEIVHRVEELFAFADQIEQQVKNAQGRVNNLTQSILAKAFRGELTADWRAENPDLISGDNSAEALLAKIQEEREALKQKTKPKKASKNKITH